MSDDYVWASPRKVSQVEGATRTWAVDFRGYTSVAVSSVTVYLEGEDVTSTAMPSGAHAVNGTIITLKPLTALKGKETYIVRVLATCDGDVDGRQFEVYCKKAGER